MLLGGRCHPAATQNKTAWRIQAGTKSLQSSRDKSFVEGLAHCILREVAVFAVAERFLAGKLAATEVPAGQKHD